MPSTAWFRRVLVSFFVRRLQIGAVIPDRAEFVCVTFGATGEINRLSVSLTTVTDPIKTLERRNNRTTVFTPERILSFVFRISGHMYRQNITIVCLFGPRDCHAMTDDGLDLCVPQRVIRSAPLGRTSASHSGLMTTVLSNSSTIAGPSIILPARSSSRLYLGVSYFSGSSDVPK